MSSRNRTLARQAGACPKPVVWCRNHGRDRERCEQHRRKTGFGCRPVEMRCHGRRCPSCGVLWGGDVRVKLLRNIEAFGGDVALTTVTAPGAASLPWDEAHCAGLGEHRHSGMHGCRVLREAAQAWNEQAKDQWTPMHRKATQRAKRRAQRDGITWPGIIAREWEFQTRGVLHMHVVLPMATPGQRLVSQVYAEALAELAERHGFGYVDRGRQRVDCTGSPAARLLDRVPQVVAARYLAKYIAAVDPKGGKITLSETVTHPDVPGHLTYVSRKLTEATGCTMRSLRQHRADVVQAWKLLSDLGSEWCAVILREFREQLVDAMGQGVVVQLEAALGP